MSFLENWEELRHRRTQIYTILLDNARYGNDNSNDAIRIPSDVLTILKNDATDLQIAINEPTNFISIPEFDYGQGKVKFKMAIEKIFLKHSAVSGGKLILVAGFPEDIEMEITVGNLITIAQDNVGLAKDVNLTGTKTFTPLNLNVGTTATPIASSSTLVNMLIIQNNSASDVYLGSSSLQNIKIPANGGILSISTPMNFKFDLSELYVSASASTTIAVMYA